MLKRGLAFALALVMLASVSVAGATGMEIEKNGQWYTEVSAWAKDGVEKAIDLGVAYWPSRGDAKTSISRCYFAEDAAAVVALAYGSDLAAYEGFRVLQLMRGTGDNQKYWPVRIVSTATRSTMTWSRWLMQTKTTSQIGPRRTWPSLPTWA